MQRFVLILLFCITFFLLIVAVQPVEFHLTNLTLVDDGFYYLGYARNIALGNGATFDGLIETNGVQPLWALILVAVGKLISDPVDFMHAALIVSVMLAIISAWAMYIVVKRLFNAPLCYVVWLFYLAMIASPQLILSGMEISANLAFFTLALAAVLQVRQIKFLPTLGAGILVGLACLGRVDNLIMTPAFAVILLWSNGTLEELRQSWRRALLSVFWLALPIVLILSFYLLFNISTFGHPLPVSGTVKSVLQERFVAEPMGGRFGIPYFLLTTQDTLRNVIHILNNYFGMPLLSFSSLTWIPRYAMVACLLVLIIVFVSRRKFLRLFRVGWLNATHWAIIAIALITLFHSWMLFFTLGVQNAGALNWYFVPEYLFLTFLIGLVLWSIGRIFRIHDQIYRAVIGILTTLLVVGCKYGDFSPPYQCCGRCNSAAHTLSGYAVGKPAFTHQRRYRLV
jgi:hypothetical protein